MALKILTIKGISMHLGFSECQNIGIKNTILHFEQFHSILLHSTVWENKEKKMRNAELTKILLSNCV